MMRIAVFNVNAEISSKGSGIEPPKPQQQRFKSISGGEGPRLGSAKDSLIGETVKEREISAQKESGVHKQKEGAVLKTNGPGVGECGERSIFQSGKHAAHGHGGEMASELSGGEAFDRKELENSRQGEVVGGKREQRTDIFLDVFSGESFGGQRANILSGLAARYFNVYARTVQNFPNFTSYSSNLAQDVGGAHRIDEVANNKVQSAVGKIKNALASTKTESLGPEKAIAAMDEMAKCVADLCTDFMDDAHIDGEARSALMREVNKLYVVELEREIDDYGKIWDVVAATNGEDSLSLGDLAYGRATNGIGVPFPNCGKFSAEAEAFGLEGPEFSAQKESEIFEGGEPRLYKGNGDEISTQENREVSAQEGPTINKPKKHPNFFSRVFKGIKNFFSGRTIGARAIGIGNSAQAHGKGKNGANPSADVREGKSGSEVSAQENREVSAQEGPTINKPKKHPNFFSRVFKGIKNFFSGRTIGARATSSQAHSANNFFGFHGKSKKDEVSTQNQDSDPLMGIFNLGYSARVNSRTAAELATMYFRGYLNTIQLVPKFNCYGPKERENVKNSKKNKIIESKIEEATLKMLNVHRELTRAGIENLEPEKAIEAINKLAKCVTDFCNGVMKSLRFDKESCQTFKIKMNKLCAEELGGEVSEPFGFGNRIVINEYTGMIDSLGVLVYARAKNNIGIHFPGVGFSN